MEEKWQLNLPFRSTTFHLCLQKRKFRSFPIKNKTHTEDTVSLFSKKNKLIDTLVLLKMKRPQKTFILLCKENKSILLGRQTISMALNYRLSTTTNAIVNIHLHPEWTRLLIIEDRTMLQLIDHLQQGFLKIHLEGQMTHLIFCVIESI